MTTPERVQLLGQFVRNVPALGIAGEEQLETLLATELGSVEALDRWLPRPSGGARRVIAPEEIYVIASGNLFLAGAQATLRGLLLGSQVVIKVAAHRLQAEEREWLRHLPKPLRERVTVLEQHDSARLRAADAVIVFGSTETLRLVAQEVAPHQRFLRYGHRVAVAFWSASTRLSPGLFTALACDITKHGQSGCLSCQMLWLAPELPLEEVVAGVRAALATHATQPITGERAARVQEYRALAALRGARVIAPETGSLAWTLAIEHEPTWAESPGGVCLSVSQGDLEPLASLANGALGTVLYAGDLDNAAQRRLLRAGARRFAPVGRGQCPAFDWFHDGFPQLRELVTYADWEE